MAVEVGIDLGTTNSVCAIMKEDGKVEIVEFDHERILPSSLYDDGKIIVGRRAKQRGMMHPENYISSSKRHMEEENYYFRQCQGKYTPEDVAKEILEKIYNQVQKQTGASEINAVITIPANYRNYAIGATKKAGIRAGFNKVKTLKEPISSVIAYGIEKDADGIYMVIDLGGGTDDLSVVRVEGNEYRTVYTGGDPRLGGDDFTEVIEKMIEDEILENNQMDFSVESITGNAMLESVFSTNEEYLKSKSRIKSKAEEAKRDLSVQRETTVDIPSLYKRAGEPVSFQMVIKREEFERRARNLFNKFTDCIEDALASIKNEEDINKEDITNVVFAGGSMNLPRAKEIVSEIFQQEPLDRDLDTIVATGAAVYSKGMTEDNSPVVVSHKLNYNIGVNVVSGELSPIIPRGTELPMKESVTERYITVNDDQIAISFAVVEGNVLSNYKDPENKVIYNFTISGLRPQPAGQAKVDITFTLTEEGMLVIHAEDIEHIAESYDNSIDWNSLRKK